MFFCTWTMSGFENTWAVPARFLEDWMKEFSAFSLGMPRYGLLSCPCFTVSARLLASCEGNFTCRFTGSILWAKAGYEVVASRYFFYVCCFIRWPYKCISPCRADSGCYTGDIFLILNLVLAKYFWICCCRRWHCERLTSAYSVSSSLLGGERLAS